MTPRNKAFDDLMSQVMATADHFGHRQHVHLTYLAVGQHGPAAALDIISHGIQQTARYAGAPQKYNATVTRAWVEIIAHHTPSSANPGAPEADVPVEADFRTFTDQNPALLDKRLLTRHYHPATLASPQARTAWVAPDRTPFPWAP